MARIAAVVLAAGRATRFGAGPDGGKVFATLQGKPLLVHVVAAAVASHVERVVVVTGEASDKAQDALVAFASINIVRNEHYASGLASSLKAGLAALPATVEGALIMLGDMPKVTSETLDRLIDRFRVEQADAVVPVHQGRFGNPTLIARTMFPRVMELTGDTGARAIMADPRYKIISCAVDDLGVLIDVDTPEMLAALRQSVRAD